MASSLQSNAFTQNPSMLPKAVPCANRGKTSTLGLNVFQMSHTEIICMTYGGKKGNFLFISQVTKGLSNYLFFLILSLKIKLLYNNV